jgi:hypothetical protein
MQGAGGAAAGRGAKAGGFAGAAAAVKAGLRAQGGKGSSSSNVAGSRRARVSAGAAVTASLNGSDNGSGASLALQLEVRCLVESALMFAARSCLCRHGCATVTCLGLQSTSAWHASSASSSVRCATVRLPQPCVVRQFWQVLLLPSY